jgi:uncharacterized protein YifE (UPF0438 family)
MTRYSYVLNQDTNLVEQNVLTTYPDTKILARGIEAGRSPELIQEQQLKAVQGAAEAPYIDTEAKWFKQQQNVEKLTQEVSDINIQLTGVEEVTDDDGVVITEAVAPITDEDIIASLNDRLDIINDKLVYSFDDFGVKQSTTKLGELNQAIASRNSIEEDATNEVSNEWLKAYRGEDTDVVRPEPSETTVLPREDTKKLIAHERDLTIRNAEDSIADLAKMMSLAYSVISTLWKLVPDDTKDNIDTATRDMIDYSVLKFDEIETRADDQLADEGIALIDKLYERESGIAEIVRKYN